MNDVWAQKSIPYRGFWYIQIWTRPLSDSNATHISMCMCCKMQKVRWQAIYILHCASYTLHLTNCITASNFNLRNLWKWDWENLSNEKNLRNLSNTEILQLQDTNWIKFSLSSMKSAEKGHPFQELDECQNTHSPSPLRWGTNLFNSNIYRGSIEWAENGKFYLT